MKKIIAIVDTLANDIVGPIWLYSHEAPAIRNFGDIAKMENSTIGRHLQDHQLEQLGILNDDLTITPERQVLITGAQWLAAQQPKDQLSLTE